MSVTNSAISAMSYTAAQAQLVITMAAIATQQQSNVTTLTPLLATQAQLLTLISSLQGGANPYGNPALVAAVASLTNTQAEIATQAQANVTALTPLLQTAEALRAQIGMTMGQSGGGPTYDGNSVLFPGGFPA